MRFGNDILDDIRSRLPCSVVVGRRVKLIKSGSKWKGLSPFNSEKTPSFYVDDHKGYYHCFSSSKHGDIFSFVMETEGLSFYETIQRLAEEAGVTLPKSNDYKPEDTQKRLDIYDALELAATFFQGQYNGATGIKAREYVATRQLSDKTVREFRIGYSPDGRNALLEHLRGKGIRDEMIEAAGLALRSENSKDLYDRFRGRLMFPIQDTKGRVVAFGGRGISADAKPKYLNSNETDVFKKGQMLFNGHRAREAAFKAKSVIVVEGYMDAIAVYQAGIEAVVATLGTAFTEEQITTLWRFADEPIICFDGDKAGKAAAYRAIDRILPVLHVGHSFRLTFLPQGQDPDDFIKAQGVQAFQAAMDAANPLWTVLWERELTQANVTSPDGQASFESKINTLVNQIGDGAVKGHYKEAAKVKLKELFWQANKGARPQKIAQRAWQPKQNNRFAEPSTSAPLTMPPSADFNFKSLGNMQGIEQIVLGLCDNQPKLAQKYEEELHSIHFTNKLPEHDLLELFPMLHFAAHGDFIERCFRHFMVSLKLRDAELELTEMVANLPAEIDEPTEQRIMALQRYILNTRDGIHVEAHELDEEATAMRTAAGSDGKRSVESGVEKKPQIENAVPF
jgi:DNA primase